MIPAKEFEGELWIKATDFHRQKKEWQGLTDEEVKEIYTATEIKVDENWRTGDKSMMFPTTLYEAIEAKLKEKNSAT